MWMKLVISGALCLGCAVAAVQAAPQDGGSVTAVTGGALIRYQGWLLVLDDARTDAPADARLMSASSRAPAPKVLLATVKHDLSLFAAFEQVKAGKRLRITSLPGPGPSAPAALLLEFGDGDYRIVIPASAVPRTEHALLAQTFPGADLALLLQDGQRVMLPLGNRSSKGMPHVFGQEQAAPYLFTKIRR